MSPTTFTYLHIDEIHKIKKEIKQRFPKTTNKEIIQVSQQNDTSHNVLFMSISNAAHEVLT